MELSPENKHILTNVIQLGNAPGDKNKEVRGHRGGVAVGWVGRGWGGNYIFTCGKTENGIFTFETTVQRRSGWGIKMITSLLERQFRGLWGISFILRINMERTVCLFWGWRNQSSSQWAKAFLDWNIVHTDACWLPWWMMLIWRNE